MSTKQIKAPKGWKLLRKGSVIRRGDEYRTFEGHWVPSSSIGIRIGKPGTLDHQSPTGCLTYIRRIPKKRASK